MKVVKVFSKKNLKKEGSKMRRLLTKTLACLMTVMLATSGISFAENWSGGVNNGTIYDYSNFAAQGSCSVIYDLVNNKETHVYANLRVTGHIGTDGSFIEEAKTYLRGNGTVAMTEDVINGTFKTFDETGRIEEAWTELDGEKYAAIINYGDDGSYSISWTGEYDSGKVDITRTEYYHADGRMDQIVSFNEDRTIAGRTVYNYDASGNNLVSINTYATTVENKDGEEVQLDGETLVSVTHFAAGKATYTESLDPENGQMYVSSRNNYEGQRKVSTDYYRPADGGGTEYAGTSYFDQFGRISYSVDNQGRETARYYYNDTGGSQTQTMNFPAQPASVTVTISVDTNGDGVIDENDQAQTVTLTDNGDGTFSGEFDGQTITVTVDEDNEVTDVTVGEGDGDNDFTDENIEAAYAAATEAQTVTVNVVPGGCLKSESYVYYGDSDYRVTTTTIYHNGSTGTPAASMVTNDDAEDYLENIMNENPDVWTAWGDPTVTGLITIDEDGIISLNITDASQMQAIFDGIMAAIAGNQEWAQKGLQQLQAFLIRTHQMEEGETLTINEDGSVSSSGGSINMSASDLDKFMKDHYANGGTRGQLGGWVDSLLNGLRLRSVLNNMKQQWEQSGGETKWENGKLIASGEGDFKLKIAAISLDKLEEMMGRADNTTGHAGEVSLADCIDEEMMQLIKDNIGQLMTLTWDYWTVDENGDVWAFVHDALTTTP